jgi:hypothetical protein
MRNYSTLIPSARQTTTNQATNKMKYALQYQDEIHGQWETVAIFGSLNEAKTATNEFGQLLSELYDEVRIATC